MRASLLAVALLLACPAAGWAKPRLKLVAVNGAAPQVQGGGWLLEDRADSVRLTNERDGRAIVRPDGGCVAYELRYPRLLLGCSGAPVLMNVATGARTALPAGSDPSPCSAGNPAYTVFGRHWLQASCAGRDGKLLHAFLGWRTGVRRTEPAGAGYFDLDDPALAKRSYARCPGSGDDVVTLPRWVLLTSADRPGEVRARRCAGGRSTLLARDAIGGFARGSWVVWHSATKIAARNLATGRYYRWNVPQADQRAGYTTRLTLTERSLYVEVPQGSGPGPRFLVFRARLA
jgi:hypothetical protein